MTQGDLDLIQRYLRRDPAGSGVAACVAGAEAQAWDRFHATHEPLVRKVARDHPVRGWSTYDLEQEVWRILLERLPKLRLDARYESVRGWVFTVARRAIANLARSESRRLETTRWERVATDDRSRSEEGSALECLERLETIARVLRALGRLRAIVPDRNYRVFELRHLEGWSTASVAVELGLSRTRVLVLDHAILEKFLLLIAQEVRLK